MRYLALAALMVAQIANAAASRGLAWDAVVTYEDGTPLESDKTVVYVVYDYNIPTAPFVFSTLGTSLTAAKFPKDSCYYITAALYSQTNNSMIPASESAPTSNVCTAIPTPPPPVTPTQKRLGVPQNLRAL